MYRPQRFSDPPEFIRRNIWFKKRRRKMKHLSFRDRCVFKPSAPPPLFFLILSSLNCWRLTLYRMSAHTVQFLFVSVVQSSLSKRKVIGKKKKIRHSHNNVPFSVLVCFTGRQNAQSTRVPASEWRIFSESILFVCTRCCPVSLSCWTLLSCVVLNI